MAKKYTFERGEYVADSVIRYITEAGYSGSHRLILGVCDFCNVIQPFRLDALMSGRTKSCGCKHRELVKQGRLRAYSLKVRNGKPIAKAGGWRERGYMIHILPQHADALRDVKIGEIIDKIGEIERML